MFKPEIVIFAGPNGSGKSTVTELLSVCDICNIYDNSASQPYRIFKKRKDKFFYDDGNEFWNEQDIKALTKITNAEKRNLNI
ncbi:MAG: ATP-binding protein [Ruminococcaceae bacterium]|nr:ATP-binding protein [Oscillospiraceae bacterium]